LASIAALVTVLNNTCCFCRSIFPDVIREMSSPLFAENHAALNQLALRHRRRQQQSRAGEHAHECLQQDQALADIHRGERAGAAHGVGDGDD
jgi:hypothetical protein